jgi:FkbM family methyltransferase
VSKYFLFDANYENKDLLKKLSKKYNINYKICLISNKIKKIKFYRMGYGSSIYNELSKFERKIDILRSTTLKLILSKKKISSKNNLLKLDVQGSELDILKGLGNKIDTFEAIILETSVRRYNQSSPLFIKIINFMYKKNFIFYDLCDLKRLDGTNSTLIQFDALFINKNSKLINKNYY